jgi:DNA-binding transcriptional LysR family regulator
MELDGITVFVKVVQAGSFTQAARVLGMPNATVSAKVARLEKRLGVTLIQRTTRKMHVTPAGRRYLERCLRGLAELEAGEAELETASHAPNGVLRVTAPADIAHSILPDVVRRYLEACPAVSVEMIVTNRAVDLVAEGVDVAIRAGRLRDSTLIARKFIPAQGGLWATPAYLKRVGEPEQPRELANYDCVLFSTLAGHTLTLSDGKRSVELPLKSRVAADDLESVKAFVLASDGIGMLTDYLAREAARTGKLVRVLPKWTWGGGHFSLVYPAQRFVSPKVQAFVTMALEQAGLENGSQPSAEE